LEAKIFSTAPNGMKVHWQVDAANPDELYQNVTSLLALAAHDGFVADNGFGTPAPARQPAQAQKAQGQSFREKIGVPAEDTGAPACETCGGPTELKHGQSQKGPWAGYFCINTKNLPQNQRHKPIWQ